MEPVEWPVLCCLLQKLIAKLSNEITLLSYVRTVSAVLVLALLILGAYKFFQEQKRIHYLECAGCFFMTLNKDILTI